jgi:glycosyltransferase involved in cell wall biosynthesis
MKFTIVTPSYNLDRWLSETIESVISQKGDFEIEYIIVDGGSKDQSRLIAERYATQVEAGAFPISCRNVSIRCIVEEGTGMYGAINSGFRIATGDVYAWINADDTYKPGAFQAITIALKTFPEIQWVKGITSTIDESGAEIRKGACKIYRQDWLRAGLYGQEAYFVEQDSVFWKKELWQKAGPMPKHMRSAADYWLWMRMAEYAPLWSLNIPISSFRKREGQISKDVKKYKNEQKQVRPKKSLVARIARIFFSPQSRIVNAYPRLERPFLALYSLLFLRPTDRYIQIDAGVPSLKKFPSYRI